MCCTRMGLAVASRVVFKVPLVLVMDVDVLYVFRARTYVWCQCCDVWPHPYTFNNGSPLCFRLVVTVGPPRSRPL